ncbi:hypothetical protein [Pseudomonas juntendi]|uniref:hypothetical protein n=1 Tax=Pseudomonas juntendi TaxID=2666183 RepID=UPI001F1848B8|nr:hypothetical protein [Pseudomonas juntendi]
MIVVLVLKIQQSGPQGCHESHIHEQVCAFVLGVSTGGPGALACAVVGGAVGGKVLGDGGGKAGEMFGDFLYGEVSE